MASLCDPRVRTSHQIQSHKIKKEIHFLDSRNDTGLKYTLQLTGTVGSVHCWLFPLHGLVFHDISVCIVFVAHVKPSAVLCNVSRTKWLPEQ